MNHVRSPLVRMVVFRKRRGSPILFIVRFIVVTLSNRISSRNCCGTSAMVLVALLGWLVPPGEGSALAASIPADTTDNPEVQKRLLRGTTEVQLGDYEEAILYFERALELAPEAPALLQALADAHQAQGDLTTALFYARQARTHGPDRPYYHRRLAELQQKAGEPDAALRTYRDLLDQFPDYERAYQALASLQAEMGRPEAALDTYRTLLNRTDRPAVAVHREMLALHRRVGNPQGIEQALRALVDRRPNRPRYRHLLGEYYVETDRPDAALDLLAPLARQHPQDASLQQLVEHLSRQTGRAVTTRSSGDSTAVGEPETLSVEQLVQKARSTLDEPPSSAAPDSTRLRRAKDLLQNALDRRPTHLAALTLLAQIHREAGNFRNAGDVLERALEDHPRDADRWTQAAKAQLKSHRYEKAVSLSEEGLLLFPGHYALARTAAQARLRSGDPKRALDHFQHALDLRTDDASTPTEAAPLHAGLGLAYTLLDRPEDADEVFDTARTTAPNHPEVLRNYAYSLALRETQLDRALEFARRATEQSPDDPLFLDTLGWVYFQRGNLDAARRHLRQALELGPPSVRILEHVGDVEHALGNDSTAREYWQKALDRAPDRTSLQKKLDDAPNS